MNNRVLKWQKVHVFISSTFNDMHAERDYLVKRVFPELQDWCERRKLRLLDIDLRWGVTEQDATHNKNVVKICLSRIDDCRPFFVCFLGQRRGWVPKKSEISVETYEYFPALRSVAGSTSVTEMEILHALFHPFHQSLAGGPAKPAEYYEPAKHAFFYLRDSFYLDQLPQDPPMLRQMYTNDAIEDPIEREVYNRELTKWREVEIPNSHRPVHQYEAKWDPTAALLTDFKCAGVPLSETIVSELKKAFEERYPQHREIEHETELEKEIDQQERFLLTAIEGYIERAGDFVELDDYVEGDSNKLFVLTAAGGMGKSTVLANWVERSRPRFRPNDSIHFRFIGQSDGTATTHSLLRSLMHEIKEISQKLRAEIPQDPLELIKRWPKLLEEIGQRGRTVIVLDALDQLESGLTNVSWIPQKLPLNVKLIVSFRRDHELAEQLYQRFSGSDQVKLSEVKPFGEVNDRRSLVSTYLAQYLKELDKQHLETLINLQGAENPLYLKVVLFELRVFGAYANLETKIRKDFGDTPVSAFQGVLQRLETDPAYTDLDPVNVVTLLFGFLARARTGLSIDELTELLMRHYPWRASSTNDEAVRRQQVRDALNLYLREVRSFTARRAGRVELFYESFRIAANQRFEGDATDRLPMNRPAPQWHQPLADLYYEEATLASQPVHDEPVYEVWVTYDIKAAMARKWMKSIVTDGINSVGSFFGKAKEPQVTPEQLILEFHQTFMTVLNIDIHEAGEIVYQLSEQGSCLVARLPKQAAEAAAAEFKALGMTPSLQPVAVQPSSLWRSTESRHYSELIFHQFEGHLWQRHIEVLTDDAFRAKCMKLHGPRFFVAHFEALINRLARDSDTSFLTELRLRIPLDNEFYLPFFPNLTRGLDDDFEQACNFLSGCAADPAQHGRAEIALRSLNKASEIKLNCRREEVQSKLRRSVELLLDSTDKRVRWQAVHAYWSLLPGADAEPLLRIAQSNTGHPLIRAEAARQLGAVEDARLVEPLLELAGSEHYPLSRMAFYSARSIQLSQRLVASEAIEHFEQADKYPRELSRVLVELGVDPVRANDAALNDRKKLLIHITECSDLSVDVHWQEALLLDKIFRLLPCRLVCSEAGVGDNSLAYLRRNSNSERRLRLSAHYFHDLLLHATEYLHLTTDYDFSLQGVEDVELYARAVKEKHDSLGQEVGLEFVASVARAQTMLNETLSLMRKWDSQVCLLITSEMPGYQISRLLGEERQFLLQMAKETGSTTQILDRSFIENLLPETVPPHLVFKPDDIVYLTLRMNRPQGEVFERDINYRHVFATLQKPSSTSIFKESETRQSEARWRPQGPFTGADLSYLDFSREDLQDNDFSHSKLCGSSFVEANLTRAQFKHANLRNADLSVAVMRDADCAGANFFQTQLSGVNLEHADLRETNLYEAWLVNARLNQATLDRAILYGASLSGAVLCRASLCDADLRNADLANVDLTSANLAGARCGGALYDRKTKWPQAFAASKEQMIMVGPIKIANPHAHAGVKLANLAFVESEQGRVQQARSIREQAVRLWEDAFGYESKELAECINTLLRQLQDDGDHEDALPLCRRAVSIWEETASSNDFSLATGLNNLGLSLVCLGQFDEAEKHLHRAVTINLQNPYPYYWLGELYRRRGFPGDAQREVMAWRRYLELGATSEQRRQEAIARLAELEK